jgi:hypothetical protein
VRRFRLWNGQRSALLRRRPLALLKLALCVVCVHVSVRELSSRRVCARECVAFIGLSLSVVLCAVDSRAVSCWWPIRLCFPCVSVTLLGSWLHQ